MPLFLLSIGHQGVLSPDRGIAESTASMLIYFRNFGATDWPQQTVYDNWIWEKSIVNH
jgi:hypothetical protein